MKNGSGEHSGGSTNTVDISCEQIEPPSWSGALQQYIIAVLDDLGVTNREVSVLLTADETMRGLNFRYREINEATDVLSFGNTPPEAEGPLGDIVIDLPLVARQAEEYHVPEEEELRRVTVHGLLHLTGYHHETSDFMHEPMLLLQEEILTRVKERLF